MIENKNLEITMKRIKFAPMEAFIRMIYVAVFLLTTQFSEIHLIRCAGHILYF